MGRRHEILFAALVAALVLVSAWVIVDDATPSWRAYQREHVRREIARLEGELSAARADLARPVAKYEVDRLARAIAAADSSLPAGRLQRLRGGLDSVTSGIVAAKDSIRRGERRLREGPAARRIGELASRLEDVERRFARATGTWPPDTVVLGRLRAERDSLAGALGRVQGPLQGLRERLLEREGRAQELRGEIARLTSTRDSLEGLRAALLEPVNSRLEGLDRLRHAVAGVREMSSPDGREIARCPTCHGTMDDAPGAHPALPAVEIFRDVPCTVCHRGHGRALRAADAHRGLLAAPESGAGRYSLRARIEELRNPDPAARARAREELWLITGTDPAAEAGATGGTGSADSLAAVAWSEWWRWNRPFFEPGEGGEDDASILLGAGLDPWLLSARGRPYRYVGSRKCLGCHEVQHRDHSRRWMATKFRSIDRLVGVADPRPCFPCHTTGYDPVGGTYAEAGVTCEACHGPGERYNEMMTVGQDLVDRGEEARGRALLSFASRLAREAVSRRMIPGDRGEVNICVSCHHPWQHREGGPGSLDRAAPVMLGGGKPRTGG